jgi:hypothetical protein
MPGSTQSEWTRSSVVHTLLLVVGLVVPLAIAWGRNGPPAERAFWLVMSYFVELAIWIAAAIVIGMVRGRERVA